MWFFFFFLELGPFYFYFYCLFDNKGFSNYIKLLLNIIFLLIDVEEVKFELK